MTDKPRSLFLIFNHTFTDAQEADARRSLNVEEIVPLPQRLRDLWSSIPPDLGEIGHYLAPLREWLDGRARPGDYVLVQGDFGACYLMVEHVRKLGLAPVYSTTRREANEEAGPDGTVRLTHNFRHERFRRYGA